MKTQATPVLPDKRQTIESDLVLHAGKATWMKKEYCRRCHLLGWMVFLLMILMMLFLDSSFTNSFNAVATAAAAAVTPSQIRHLNEIDGIDLPKNVSSTTTTKRFRHGYYSGQTTPSVEARIVGGAEVNPPLRFQYLAALFVSNRAEGELVHVCGGSLIQHNIVLSSAHCMKRQPDVIRIGAHDLQDTNNVRTETFFVTEMMAHPKYREDDGGNHYDVALFLLDGSSTFDPIKLNTFQYKPKNGASLSVIGWGATKYQGPSSPVPMIAQVKSVSNRQCNQLYGSTNNNLIKSYMMCAGAPGKDACSGDSGGPLIIQGPKEDASKDRLVGVVSSGFECGRDDVPGVYARVSSVAEWIQEESKAMSPERVDDSGSTFETDRMAGNENGQGNDENAADGNNNNSKENESGGGANKNQESSKCKDETSFVGRKGQARQCDWVRKRKVERCKDHWMHCKKSCGKCPP